MSKATGDDGLVLLWREVRKQVQGRCKEVVVEHYARPVQPAPLAPTEGVNIDTSLWHLSLDVPQEELYRRYGTAGGNPVANPMTSAERK